MPEIVTLNSSTRNGVFAQHRSSLGLCRVVDLGCGLALRQQLRGPEGPPSPAVGGRTAKFPPFLQEVKGLLMIAHDY